MRYVYLNSEWRIDQTLKRENLKQFILSLDHLCEDLSSWPNWLENAYGSFIPDKEDTKIVEIFCSRCSEKLSKELETLIRIIYL